MAGKTGKKDAVKNAVIHTQVHLGEPKDIGGFGIAVDIKVEGVVDETLIQAGHEVRSTLGDCLAVLLCTHSQFFAELPLQSCIDARSGRQCFEGVNPRCDLGLLLREAIP